jgi:succinate dehydrogenase/fumarate reductase flavoprotein subunit
MTQLLQMSGCRVIFVPALGGMVPVHDENQETTVSGIYVAGDASGIEEASTAIIEGRIAGLGIAHSMGYMDDHAFEAAKSEQLRSMEGLRSGSHGEGRKVAKEYLNAMMKG